jgi:predicted transcriptional regulator
LAITTRKQSRDAMTMDERLAKALTSRREIQCRHREADHGRDQFAGFGLRLTVQIVAAHVENNLVAIDALPGLIEQVYRTLRDATQTPIEAEKPAPAVPVKQSIKPDFIVCLEDGKKLKTLRRHLLTLYNLTPEQYRARWGLAADYPMVAPNYAKLRSSLAKRIGLGRKAETPERTKAPGRTSGQKRGRKAGQRRPRTRVG